MLGIIQNPIHSPVPKAARPWCTKIAKKQSGRRDWEWEEERGEGEEVEGEEVEGEIDGK